MEDSDCLGQMWGMKIIVYNNTPPCNQLKPSAL